MTPLSELICELNVLAERWKSSGLSIEDGEKVVNALPRLLEELEAHRDMLKEIEFGDNYYEEPVCPICECCERDNREHAKDCRLAALLSRWEPKEAGEP